MDENNGALTKEQAAEFDEVQRQYAASQDKRKSLEEIANKALLQIGEVTLDDYEYFLSFLSRKRSEAKLTFGYGKA